MSEKLKHLAEATWRPLFWFGIGFALCVLTVNYTGSTAWQEPLATVMWVYLAVVMAHLILLRAVPLLLDWFSKTTED